MVETPESNRIASLRRMVAERPADPRARFGLAVEYERLGLWAEAVEQLERYLELADDEGNAWGRLGRAYRALDRTEDAKAAFSRGVEAAERHGHPTMAMELSDELEEL